MTLILLYPLFSLDAACVNLFSIDATPLQAPVRIIRREQRL